MCSQARCRQCGKITWTGCGSHIEMALAGVPDANRCRCKDEPAPSSGGIFKNIFG